MRGEHLLTVQHANHHPAVREQARHPRRILEVPDGCGVRCAGPRDVARAGLADGADQHLPGASAPVLQRAGDRVFAGLLSIIERVAILLVPELLCRGAFHRRDAGPRRADRDVVGVDADAQHR